MPENQQLYHNWVDQQQPGWSSIAEIIDFEGDMPDMDSAALIHEATRNLLDLVMEARETIKALHDLGETCPAKESITDNYCPNNRPRNDGKVYITPKTYQRHAVVDFDNTLSGYDSWKGPDVFGPIIPYAKEALCEMREWGWQVIVFTTRGNDAKIKEWLTEHDLGWCAVNSTAHNPPGLSNKPIAEVYFDDRDAHCVGRMPYNWHNAMSRVRARYQPKLTTYIDDAATWAGPLTAWFVAPFVRRRFAATLPGYFARMIAIYRHGWKLS